MGGVLKKLHLPYKWMAGTRIRHFFENDIMIDTSGIAFTDDRSFANVFINALWFLPALISDIPTVKVSQTLGPYKKRYVRFFSKWILSRIRIIICRGRRSYDYTRLYLKRDNIFNCPDVAFCLKTCQDAETNKLYAKYGIETNHYITVGPSFVMRDFMRKGEYSNIIAEGLNKLSREIDKVFIFVPHSWKHSDQIGVDSVNDDISVCREVIGKLDPDIRHILIDEEISAHEFKSIISGSYMAIGSRYHFLIAALSSGVPSMAMGWSHKYHELFREFSLEKHVIGYEDMDKDKTSDMMMKLLENRDNIKKQIDELLPQIIWRSKQNEKLIFEYR